MRRLTRGATPVLESNWTTLVDRLRSQLGIERPVALRRTNDDTMPLVAGIRHPVILLPRGSESWTVSRRRAVLAHELAHVARNDVLTLMLGQRGQGPASGKLSLYQGLRRQDAVP